MSLALSDSPTVPPEPVETPEDLRALYHLTDGVTFLNHGSYGACPKPVFAYYQAWQKHLEEQPVLFVGRRQEDLLNTARGYLGTYLNTAPDNLSFVTNTTGGLNVIVRSLDLRPGDEILTTDLEYGALDLTWNYLCERSGARYVKQPTSMPVTSESAFVEAFWDGVTDRTRAIFLSHITSATALTLPIQQICERAREAGILTIIDGAHVPGQIALDLTALGADIYAGNFHKWLGAPKGSAFLYVAPEHHDWVESATISWGWSGDHTFVTRNQQQGTRDVAAFLTVPAAIDVQRAYDWHHVRQRCHAMARETRMRLHAMLGTTPISPDDGEWYTQMTTITVPTSDVKALQHRLFWDHGIEIPGTTHGDDWSFIRVSVQGYTTEDDMNRLENALRTEFAVP